MPTVAGAVLRQLAASPALTALCPAASMRLAEIPPEEGVPPGVVLADEVTETVWYTPTSYLEKHEVTATAFGPGAASAGQQNPADAIMDQVEAAVDWTNLGLAGTLTVGLKRERRDLAAASGRTDNAGRVFKATAVWLVNLWTGP